MIIDGHAHACGKFLSAESIISHLDKNKVDKLVLVPGELNSKAEYGLPNIASMFPKKNVVKITNALTKFALKLSGKAKDIPAGNNFVNQLTQDTKGRVIQLVWITQYINNIEDYLDTKYKEWGFKGVKMHQCWESFSINSEYFATVATWAENNNLPLFIHLHKDKQVKQLIDYKRKHPKLKLIVAHLFGLELFIQEKFKDDNLYFDISPLQLTSNHRVMQAIKFVGAHKILFGTDTPYGGKDNIALSINRVNNLDIPKKEKDLILGLSIKSLLDLK